MTVPGNWMLTDIGEDFGDVESEIMDQVEEQEFVTEFHERAALAAFHGNVRTPEKVRHF